MNQVNDLGVVVIGRNEGDRLKRCIESILLYTNLIVYVDSGSTDGSADWAVAQGVGLVNLDLNRPFTAARARNEGFRKLKDEFPQVNFVQFVDGDCEVQSTWFANARDFLIANSSVAVVCGRRREKYPQRSVYNALCDIEWDTPIGEAKSCGGDSLVRADVFDQVGGFRPELIAGEEPELCFRIRDAGYEVWRINEEMTLHDAAITRFSQWWRRTERAGYAYALGASMHGSSDERFRVREVMRIIFWGGGIPILALALSIFSPFSLLLFAIYPAQFLRLLLRSPVRGKIAVHWALFTVIGKIPEFVGGISYLWNRLTKKQATIIEYK